MEAKEAIEVVAGEQTQGLCLTALAELPEMAMLDDRALAQALGVCERTVRRMAIRGELPPLFDQSLNG